jgi:hypothetical protein
VIIADTAIESPILEHVMNSGARGYNCIYCFGKGRHETLEDPFTGRSRVRIEVLVRDDVAVAIMKFVHEPQFGPYPIHAFMDTVEVDPRDLEFF